MKIGKLDISKINKSYIVAGVIVLLVIAVVGAIAIRSSSQEEISAEDEPTEKPEQLDIIPTVDASVKVDLEGIDNNRGVLVTVDNAPKGTEEVEASITYFRVEPGVKQPVQDGSFQTVEIEDGSGEVEMLLGTESSGIKRYHKLSDGEIRVEMLFIGDYGEQVFQDTFQLDI